MIQSAMPLVLLALLPVFRGPVAASGDTTRICLAPTSVEASTGSATTAADAVRETFTPLLTGPSIGVQPLTARLSSQVREEARQAQCRYLLLTTIKQQRKKKSNILGRATSEAVQRGAWHAAVASGSVAGTVAASAVAGAASGATWDLAYQVRTNDELSLTVRLEEADGTALLEKSDKRKASSDGEDLLTPLAQRAAEAVAAAVTGTSTQNRRN